MSVTGIAGVAGLGFGGLAPGGTRVDIFQQIYWVFLLLGAVVGTVVIGYMVYNAYKYRDGSGKGAEADVDRPQLGELPEGGGGGRKLFLSFGLSTVVVVSLIAWTYGTLLIVETGPPPGAEDSLEVQVEGYRFGWQFTYPNGHTTNTLRVPEDRTIRLVVSSRDVFHTFGIPEFKVKTDAIPGQETDGWFVPTRTGTFEAQCYELCGSGHSYMTAEVRVTEPAAFQAWYENTTDASANETANATTNQTRMEAGA